MNGLIGLYIYTIIHMYIHATYVQRTKIICMELIFSYNQPSFYFRIKALKEYCFYNGCNNQNKRAQYFSVHACIVFYTRVLRWWKACYTRLHTCVSQLRTRVYIHGLMPYVVFCLLCSCVMHVGFMLRMYDTRGSFKLWVICTVSVYHHCVNFKFIWNICFYMLVETRP